MTAALVHHAGRTIIEVGDVSCPVHIHSMRKSIISALFGQAYDRGEVDLNATLGELGIDDTPRLTDKEKSARIEDLLAARSGVYLPTDGGDALGRPSRGSHPPGTFWCYNNWDFNVLGNIYERITGRSLFVAFDHDLARPLGMVDWDVYQHGSYQYRRRYPRWHNLGTRTTRFICLLEISPDRAALPQRWTLEWPAAALTGMDCTQHRPSVAHGPSGRIAWDVRLLLVGSRAVG